MKDITHREQKGVGDADGIRGEPRGEYQDSRSDDKCVEGRSVFDDEARLFGVIGRDLKELGYPVQESAGDEEMEKEVQPLPLGPKDRQDGAGNNGTDTHEVGKHDTYSVREIVIRPAQIYQQNKSIRNE